MQNKPVIPDSLLLPINNLTPIITNKDGSAKISSIIGGYCKCAEQYYELKAKYEALQKVRQ